MKNPLRQTLECWQWWRQLRPTGFFSWADAKLQIDRVILPARFAYQRAGRELKRLAQITDEGQGVHKITLPESGLHFYWQGAVDNNLYFLIEQELTPNNPHCYTTDPIRLTPETVVIDVGACEGLFGFRALKHLNCQRVICFEPLPSMAALIQRAGDELGLTDRLTVETLAVADISGPVRLVATDNPDACHIESWNEGDGTPDAQAVRLDDYLADQGRRLSPHDLIKIDAEGTDLAVIEGASETIARDRPQIAVTTYHADEHAEAISKRLRELNPSYRFRLKGFAHWTTRPRPVLLQAADSSAA